MQSWALLVIASAALLATGAMALVWLRRRRETVSAPIPASNSHVPQPGPLEVVGAASCARATGSSERAIYVLTRYLQRTAGDGPCRPEPWDMLLDLYHEGGHRTEFKALASQYAGRLGGQVPEFDRWSTVSGRAGGGLERNHPQFAEQLRRAWKDPRAARMVEGMLRECGRPGRPPLSSECVADLLALRAILRDRSTHREAPRADERGADPAYRAAIEAGFPRIAAEIVRLWPDSRCRRYLDRLAIDERGSRRGFDREIMEEILLLREILEANRPGDRESRPEAIRP